MTDLEPLLSAQDLADFLHVPIATIYALRYRHEGHPGFRVGRHLRYRRNDVEQWISRKLEDQKPESPFARRSVRADQ